MAATSQTVTSSSHSTFAPIWYGTWTTDSTKGDHTITFPVHIGLIKVFLDASGVPDTLEKFAINTTDTMLRLGADGIASSPTDATGITITNNSDGTSTVLVDANSMTNDGVNYWYAYTLA